MDEQEYEIEEILASKFKQSQNQVYYLVKWLNWDIQHSTWEPEKNLQSATQAIQEFLSTKKKNGIEFEWAKVQKFREFWEENPKQQQQQPSKKRGRPRKKSIIKDPKKTNKKIKKPKQAIKVDSDQSCHYILVESNVTLKNTDAINPVSNSASFPVQKSEKVQIRIQKKQKKMEASGRAHVGYPKTRYRDQNLNQQQQQQEQAESFKGKQKSIINIVIPHNHILLQESSNPQNDQNFAFAFNKLGSEPPIQPFQKTQPKISIINCQPSLQPPLQPVIHKANHQNLLLPSQIESPQSLEPSRFFQPESKPYSLYQSHLYHSSLQDYPRYEYNEYAYANKNQNQNQIGNENLNQNQNDNNLFNCLLSSPTPPYYQHQGENYLNSDRQIFHENRKKQSEEDDREVDVKLNPSANHNQNDDNRTHPNPNPKNKSYKYIILGIKRIQKKQGRNPNQTEQSQKNDRNRFKYLVQNLHTKKRFWFGKEEILRKCPDSLIKYYEDNIIFKDQKNIRGN